MNVFFQIYCIIMKYKPVPGANLERAFLWWAKYDHYTHWQAGFDPQVSGAILIA